MSSRRASRNCRDGGKQFPLSFQLDKSSSTLCKSASGHLQTLAVCTCRMSLNFMVNSHTTPQGISVASPNLPTPDYTTTRESGQALQLQGKVNLCSFMHISKSNIIISKYTTHFKSCQSFFYYLAQWFLEKDSKDHEKHYEYILKHDSNCIIRNSVNLHQGTTRKRELCTVLRSWQTLVTDNINAATLQAANSVRRRDSNNVLIPNKPMTAEQRRFQSR